MTALRELVDGWRLRGQHFRLAAKDTVHGDDFIRAFHRGTKTATEVCADELAAALSAQEERVCGTCAYQRGDICGKVSIPGHSVAVVSCAQLGNTCGAFVAKEGLR